MKAAVSRGTQKIVIEDVPTPEPGPNQVLVKVRYSAICGSDVHRFQYGAMTPGSIMGHEYIGEVVQTGAEVTLVKTGDRVVGGGGEPPAGVPGPVSAGARYSARTVGLGLMRFGGFAEYVVMDEWRPLPIPPGVSDELAVLAEPASVAMHAVRTSKFKIGDATVVMGAGPIGLLTMQVLNAGGAEAVYVSEPAPARAEAARVLGAALVMDPRDSDVVAKVVELSGGLGVPVAFDAAAAKPTLQQGLEMVRRGGQVLLVSMAWEDVDLLTVEWIGREVELKAVYGAEPIDWRTGLNLMERGQLSSQSMVTDQSFIGFDEMQSSLERLMKPEEHVQLVLVP
ncbi:MAG: zinc-binding dehydrogenase [Dehalococcoidia bacterium]|jgi:(R,R)-butanediol dehydrogenase/meso-butanediol dehydrogenase/diacetyl reductase|nr:zinc-binding dehydrogenase [Dehalococcoidia bacterium]